MDKKMENAMAGMRDESEAARNTSWSLEELYHGFEDPRYQEEQERAAQLIAELEEAGRKLSAPIAAQDAERLLLLEEKLEDLFRRLGGYASLRQSVDTENSAIAAQVNQVERLMASAKSAETVAAKLLASVTKEEQAKSLLLQEYRYYLELLRKQSRHLFSEEMEDMISNLRLTGSSAWGSLFSYLTSTVPVAWKEGTVTLSEIRNLAYDPSAEVRRAAYEAELASYDRIAPAIAFALNSIKNEVKMLSRKRGYESPLAMTLEQSRMKRETLDAMMTAMEEYLPKFQEYLRAKGRLLGHANGLPWYDLFAPVGKSDRVFSIEEARNYLIETFGVFSTEMADMMQQAFDHRWIDFYPKKGKEGGAFCADVPSLSQSRILTNYDGSFGAVQTLAHELGHAFHDQQVFSHRSLNMSYSMPVAETASTFNETHLLKTALKTAQGEEKLNLLEHFLMETTQIICDIDSRYLFETEVFERCEKDFLMAEDCKEIMLRAQKKAYGDGLDPEYLHPYMWACKSHYYSGGVSFYNFPYAFGGLFAMGLYAQYEKEGAAFVEKYKRLLHATPVVSVEDAAAIAEIDLTQPDFWRESLKAFAVLIDEFTALCPAEER